MSKPLNVDQIDLLFNEEIPEGVWEERLMLEDKETLIRMIKHTKGVLKNYSDKYYNSAEWGTEVEKQINDVRNLIDNLRKEFDEGKKA